MRQWTKKMGIFKIVLALLLVNRVLYFISTHLSYFYFLNRMKSMVPHSLLLFPFSFTLFSSVGFNHFSDLCWRISQFLRCICRTDNKDRAHKKKRSFSEMFSPMRHERGLMHSWNLQTKRKCVFPCTDYHVPPSLFMPLHAAHAQVWLHNNTR